MAELLVTSGEVALAVLYCLRLVVAQLVGIVGHRLAMGLLFVRLEERLDGRRRRRRLGNRTRMMWRVRLLTDMRDFREEDERHTSEKDFKPVFLKGLFRYGSPALIALISTC
jgi:hypothetical protein